MITARQTSVVRVADLASFRATLTAWIGALTPAAAADTFVLVPTHAAAEHLRRTVEDQWLSPTRPVLAWPLVATRRDLYDEIAARLPVAGHRLSAVEREVLVAGVARDVAAQGLEPPFAVRPGLVAAMLDLYDHIRRLGRQIEDFDRNVSTELEREQDTDRGAARLLQQTRFLTAVYRAYEARLAASCLADEHVLRLQAMQSPSLRPLRRVVVALGDRLSQPEGYWPADLDLLTRLPGLAALDVLATEAVLASGYLERLHAALPGVDERPGIRVPRALPRLIVPAASGSEARLLFTARDREEELLSVARRVKQDRRAGSAPPIHKTALVVRRPLPYLYLARQVFAEAGIPFETSDALPLAAEPYAAALDLVLDAVASDFSRTALMALVRSPHLRIEPPPAAGGAARVSPARMVAALDAALAEARYLGGLDRLQDLVSRWLATGAPRSREERRQHAALPLAQSLVDAVVPLAPLSIERRLTEQIATLLEWLDRFGRPVPSDPRLSAREARVRGTVRTTLDGLQRAHARHDPDARADIGLLTAAIRHALSTQTVATEMVQPGLAIVDAITARFGEFDDVQLMGLIDGEWPEAARSTVLYPASLLAPLEPQPAVADPGRRDRDRLAAARAAFRDLARSAGQRLRASTFVLEQDAVVEPSILADELAALGLPTETWRAEDARVTLTEGLALDPPVIPPGPDAMSSWARVRLTTDTRGLVAYRGAAGPWHAPRVSVSRLERYLDCPFRYFASEVLRLEEQPEDEDTRTPLERGRFLHELWERFFAAWQARGHGRIEPALLPEARPLFEALCEAALATLPPAEAALERHRLLGSAISPGIAHRVFAMEADQDDPILERLLEFPLQGDFTFRGRDGATRVVALSAKIDRIDVLSGGRLRVIDYKSKTTPDVKQALQLPIYSSLARDALGAQRGGQWALHAAMYLSFEGEKAVTSLKAKGRTLDELVDDAHVRLLATLDAIASGQFPASPSKKSLCGPCPYRTVCRLDYTERPEHVDD